MIAHSFNPVILREYDIRGQVGKTLFEAAEAGEAVLGEQFLGGAENPILG